MLSIVETVKFIMCERNVWQFEIIHHVIWSLWPFQLPSLILVRLNQLFINLTTATRACARVQRYLYISLLLQHNWNVWKNLLPLKKASSKIKSRGCLPKSSVEHTNHDIVSFNVIVFLCIFIDFRFQFIKMCVQRLTMAQWIGRNMMIMMVMSNETHTIVAAQPSEITWIALGPMCVSNARQHTTRVASSVSSSFLFFSPHSAASSSTTTQPSKKVWKVFKRPTPAGSEKKMNEKENK